MTYLSIFFLVFLPISINFKSNKAIIIINIIDPISPKTLAYTANIKSVCGSGIYNLILNPWPNNPADPIEVRLFSN